MFDISEEVSWLKAVRLCVPSTVTLWQLTKFKVVRLVKTVKACNIASVT
jgi:hypothetical protein